MGGLFDTLNIGRSTLEASQAGVQVTGHNISNANTEGFHRRRLDQSPEAPPPGGLVILGGVRTNGSARVTNRLLNKQVNTSLGLEAKADTTQGLMMQVESASARIGSDGLGGAISNLFSKMSSLSTSPSDTTVREVTLQSAKTLSQTFNQVASDLSTIQKGADENVATTVSQINSKTAEIAALNAKIIATEAHGHEASDLRDQQDKLLNDLAKLCGATGFADGDGMMTVMLGSAAIVQREKSLDLAATPSAALSGMSRVDLKTSANISVDITSQITSGQLGAYIDVRDSVITGIQTRVDQLAYDLSTNVNTQHRAGFGLDGLGNRNLFVNPTVVAGAAAAMALDTNITAARLAASSTATGVPGNNVNALALTGLGKTNLASGNTTTFNGEATATAAAVGLQVSDAKADVLVRKDELTYMQKLHQSEIGVSLDDEMINLIQFQRAYQSGVKVISVVDGLLKTVIRM